METIARASCYLDPNMPPVQTVISDNLSRAGQLVVAGCVYKAVAYVKSDGSPEKLGISTVVSLLLHDSYLIER